MPDTTPTPGTRQPAHTNCHRKVKPANTEPAPQGRGNTGQPHTKKRPSHPPPPLTPDPPKRLARLPRRQPPSLTRQDGPSAHTCT